MRAYPALLAALILASCQDTGSKAGPSDRGDRDPAAADKPAAVPALPTFVRCVGRELAPREPKGFAHGRSKLVAALPAMHSAQDVLTLVGQTFTVPGKFAHGDQGKDLEDEQVKVFADDCQGWKELGTVTTDDDGRAGLTVDAGIFPGPGTYDVRQLVVGDGNRVQSRLTLVPRGTQLVVFDIDGTLTTDDAEITREYLESLRGKERPPKTYPDATGLTRAWADKGFVIVYLTGRPYWLTELTRTWLAGEGFAPGHLHTTDRQRDILPTNEGVGEFKTAYLQSLIDDGLVIAVAYGNARTDVSAYAAVGVPAERTFIIGQHGGLGRTQRLAGGYTKHLEWVRQHPAAEQPFTR